MSVLAIDAGTTGVTAVVVTAQGTIAAKGYQEFAQHFPKPGWVEHSPEEIWQATLEATRAALEEHDQDDVQAIGITNQRETVLLWDRETLGSPRRAIVWQDRRTASICTRLREEGHEDRVAELTGLRLDPYFSGTKLLWLAENEPNTWALVGEGRYAIGSSSPRNDRGSVVAISPHDGTTSGSASRGTPNSEHSSSLQSPCSRSNSRVREAFDTSVTCQVPRVIRAIR